MNEEKTTWSKETALNMLTQLAKTAAEAATEIDGDNITLKNQTAMVALRAIDLANKMCGFASPSDEAENEYKRLEDII